MLVTLIVNVAVSPLRIDCDFGPFSILIAGDFGRAVLLVTIPIAYVADALTLGQLFVVGFPLNTDNLSAVFTMGLRLPGAGIRW